MTPLTFFCGLIARLTSRFTIESSAFRAQLSSTGLGRNAMLLTLQSCGYRLQKRMKAIGARAWVSKLIRLTFASRGRRRLENTAGTTERVLEGTEYVFASCQGEAAEYVKGAVANNLMLFRDISESSPRERATNATGAATDCSKLTRSTTDLNFCG